MDDALNTRPFTVLVAPLDWGLGHTTRSIPVIRALLQHQCRVMIAGTPLQELVFREEFGPLPFLPLPGYRITYGRSALSTTWKITKKIPSMIRAIRREHGWLKHMVPEHGIQAVFSDNRYGLWHPQIPSVLVSHQLQVKTPYGAASDRALQQLLYRYVNRFTECWVPDYAENPGLAGMLSHPARMPRCPTRYVGPLTRFRAGNESHSSDRILILLSGPEPQRSILEDSIINDLAAGSFRATVVRGLPGHATQIPSTPSLRFINYLSAGELEKEIREAAWVVGRCGYSTVMDLMCLQKKSILIPTPGQTEQEYLARHLASHHYAFCPEQQHFSLGPALEKAASFPYRFPAQPATAELLSEMIGSFLESSGR